MEAPIYAWSRGAPPDEAVARVVQDRPWDEALSGAAAHLALGATSGESTDLAQARWAAYRAGWPYPVDEVVIQMVASGELPVPPPSLECLALGVARARGAQGDAWVWLASTPPVELKSFRREQDLGQVLHLETHGESPLTLRTVAPSGQKHGPAPVLNEAGEWLVEFSAQGTRWVLPIYVDGLTPADAPYPGVLPPPNNSRAAIEQALEVLDEYRATFEADPLERDPMLNKAAARALEAQAENTPLPDAQTRLKRLGFNGHLAEMTCTAATVPECMDLLYWSVDHRHDLVDPALEWVGVAASLGPGGVTLLVNLAQQ